MNRPIAAGNYRSQDVEVFSFQYFLITISLENGAIVVIN
jgi:hypothetical protein